MFGTYVRAGELLVYPFFEYSADHNREYQPAQFGFGAKEDFLGKYRSTNEQLFIAYGLSDRLALEFEAALMRAVFDKSGSDLSGTPAKIEESGFGDIEGHLRVRWIRENSRRPEVFSYLEVTAPSQKDKRLIGDKNWDFKPGIGVVRGFSWGTLTLRSDLEYNRETSGLDIGETAVEYLRRLSPSWRVFSAIEGGEGGAPDEWDLVTGVQWRVTEHVFLKLDNSLGISSKATDWAPQIGCLFAFPASTRVE